MRTTRCAIYTRKSSEEGLEQDFNSLDAQREACAAYIRSQASEGWVALPEVYDDGGISGGTLQRPSLQRLLADVAAGRVDTVVVYKVDRLTRSLLDFSKLVEAFDKAGVSFVSVTQSFNTTTSMGRLTLNMLLSFAQFEREVTAERIRDKIAASKARGMWMGGTPPLGYAPNGRTLKIVEEHASNIRHVFARYLALGNVRLLAEELTTAGIVNPMRSRVSGTTFGGSALGRGQLYTILRNPIYIGRIPHGNRSHAGLHPAIIDQPTWDAVQAQLADNRTGERARVRAASPSLLAGKVVDDKGQPLIATHANKCGRRYRYYVSRTLSQATSDIGMRIPAIELEAVVIEQVAQAFDDPFAIAASANLTLTPGNTAALAQRAADTANLLRKRERTTTRAIITQVRVHPGRIEIDCAAEAIAEALGLDPSPDTSAVIALTANVALTRTGMSMRLVQDNGATVHRTASPSLVKLLVKARRWWKVLSEGEVNIAELATTEGVQSAYVTRVLRLAFLSPTVVDAILKGNTRSGIDAAALTSPTGVPACWRQQARMMLPAG